MPRRDGTGPEGMGVMTGRGTGFCSGYALSGDAGWLGYGCGADSEAWLFRDGHRMDLPEIS